MIGEIEFDSKEQSGDFEPPAWMGREITGDERYAGQSLALHASIGVGEFEPGKHRGMSTRATRALTRAAGDRRAQVAAGALAAAGAGAVAGKVAIDHLHEEDGSKGNSRSYRLKGKESPTNGIRRIALGRAQKAADELNDARNGTDFATSVHAARKT